MEETRKKIYVDVIAEINPAGFARPLEIRWEDGRKFEVNAIKDVRKAASLKAGGAGLRYTIRIGSNTTYLFLEESRWFVEGKQQRRIRNVRQIYH